MISFMAPQIIALLFFVASTGAIWFFMNMLEEKKVREERIGQLLKEKTAFRPAPPSPKPSEKKEEDSVSFIEKKSRIAKYKKMFPLMFFSVSVFSSYLWYQLDPVQYPVKLAVAVGFCIFLPRFWSSRMKTVYRNRIEEDLPRGLDLLVVCVEAGLSINSALVRVAAESGKSPLAQEFRHTFHELNASLPLEQAFKNLGDRSKVADLQTLATSIVQAEKLGIGLASTLRTQAKILRETIRMRTRERIFKIPVKMIIPIVLFIMPAIFVIIAGPAIIQIKAGFIK